MNADSRNSLLSEPNLTNASTRLCPSTRLCCLQSSDEVSIDTAELPSEVSPIYEFHSFNPMHGDTTRNGDSLFAVIRELRDKIDSVESKFSSQFDKLSHDFQEVLSKINSKESHVENREDEFVTAEQGEFNLANDVVANPAPQMIGQPEKNFDAELLDQTEDAGGTFAAKPESGNGNDDNQQLCVCNEVDQQLAVFGQRSSTFYSADISYQFQESIWDAAIFIGTSPFGMGASLVMFLLLLLTVTMQILYTVIVMYEFTDPRFGDNRLDGLRKFRVRVAHDIKYNDPITGASLAASLCKEDETLEVAGQQLGAFGAINKYLSGKLFGENTGPLMCCLACLVWCLAVQAQMKKLMNMALSVLKLIRGKGFGRKTRLLFDGNVWAIDALSKKHCVLIVLVSALRLAVAGVLLRAGMMYLINTIELRDLVLNAVALECVLLLDEYCYSAFAPAQVMQFLASVENLPLPESFSGLDLQTVVGLVCSAAMLAGLVPALLGDLLQNIHRARDILCQGEQNFAYVRTNYPPYISWSFTDSLSASASAFMEEAVQSVIDQSPNAIASAYKSPTIIGSSWAALTVSQWQLEEVTTKRNAMCIDVLSGGYMPTGYALALASVDAPNVSSCADLFPYCDEDTQRGAAARGVCPVTCGCHRPDSALVFSAYGAGCPSSCYAQPLYQGVLDSTPCVDESNQTLRGNSKWIKHANMMVIIAQGAPWPDKVLPLLRKANESMLAHGCHSINMLRTSNGGNMGIMNLCDEHMYRTWPFKSLRLFCPVTCGCNPSGMNCPKACPVR